MDYCQSFEISEKDISHVNEVIQLMEQSSLSLEMIFLEFLEKSCLYAGQKKYNLAKLFKLLGEIASLRLESYDPCKPYKQGFKWQGQSSPNIEDLNKGSLELLADQVANLQSSILKAQVADVLWIRLRRREFAKLAVENFFDINESFHKDTGNFLNCIRRALMIGSLFKKWPQNNCLFEYVINKIEDLITVSIQSNDDYQTIELINIEIDFKRDMADKYLKEVKQLAEKIDGTKSLILTKKAWEVCVKLSRIVGNHIDEHSSMAKLAECYVREVEFQVANNCSYLTVTQTLSKAIEIYKNVKGSQDKQKELYALLLEYQKKSMKAMHSVASQKIDLSLDIQASVASVQGKPLEEALLILAFQLGRLPNYSLLRQQAKESELLCPILSTQSCSVVDAEGKFVGHSGYGESKNDENRSFELSIMHRIDLYHERLVKGAIEPARNQICFEHFITENVLEYLVLLNPFIPHGHEYLYLKGLYAGLLGDFIVAGHILLPQLENSLRYLLNKKGVITSSLNPYGVQEEIRFNEILNKIELIEILGNDMVEDLKILLANRTYTNLRNKISHGLMEAVNFSHHAVKYFWWLTLRLCLAYNVCSSS